MGVNGVLLTTFCCLVKKAKKVACARVESKNMDEVLNGLETSQIVLQEALKSYPCPEPISYLCPDCSS